MGKQEDREKELEVQKLHARFNTPTQNLIRETDDLIERLKKSRK